MGVCGGLVFCKWLRGLALWLFITPWERGYSAGGVFLRMEGDSVSHGTANQGNARFSRTLASQGHTFRRPAAKSVRPY